MITSTRERTRDKGSACVDCGDEVEHCHETLVIHADGVVECLGDDCVGEMDVHVLVLGCDELEPPCRCASS